MKRMFLVLFIMSFSLQAGLWTIPPVSAADVQSTLQQQSEETITSGAIMKKHVWSSVRKGQKVNTNAIVVQVDLQNPNVKLDVMTGTGGQLTKEQSVLGMVKDTGAVAGTNGDFFNPKAEGVPDGPEISDGKLVSTPPFLPGFFSFAITKDNKPIIDLFTFRGKITAKDGTTYPLGGINKTYYWFEPNNEHSMIDGLFMYTSLWGQEDRSNDGKTDPTEVLVVNNKVVEIVRNDILRMIPPKDGYILRSAGKAAEFVVNHLKVGDVITADYDIPAQDPTKTYDYKQFKMMIGGHTILVDEGKPTEYSREVGGISGYSGVSRTAIGYSEDGRYAYVITADGSGDSKGLTLAELQDLMIKVGVWKGMNLDGGGSTQMAARPLGETEPRLMNQTDYGYQRKVVNGVGIFSLAPKGTKAQGLTVGGDRLLFLGEKASFPIRAYDEYYNPMNTADIKTVWTSSEQIGNFNDQNQFTPVKKGKTTLTATSGDAKQSFDVQVVGRDDLDQIKIQAYPAVLNEGADVTLSVTAKTKDGTERQIPADILQWEFSGLQGTISGNTLHVNKLEAGKTGVMTARYDGFGSTLALPAGDKRLWADYDTLIPFGIGFKGTDGVTGGVSTESDKKTTNGNYITLEYDLSKGSDTKAAYATFGDGGVSIYGEPQALSLKVKGDNSLNWFRLEMIDSKGKAYLLDVTKAINWSGWKTLTVDLSASKPEYPVKLTRLYVVSVEQGQDERALTGKVSFDDLTLEYKGQLAELPKNKVKLTINKNAITVNGSSATIDQAPVIVKGNTLVPIRFVTEAIGGKVDWNEAERRITVFRGGQSMDFWLGQVDYVADGQRKTAEVSPELMNERTLVPLRVLSEHFGWKVTWDEKTRNIMLE